MVTLLLGCLVALVSNVAHANDSPYHKYGLSKVDAPKTELSSSSDELTLNFGVAVLAPELGEFMRYWVAVDYSATPLPNHKLLPSPKLYLINCSIRQC